jgi:hypothetical protein
MSENNKIFPKKEPFDIEITQEQNEKLYEIILNHFNVVDILEKIRPQLKNSYLERSKLYFNNNNENNKNNKENINYFYYNIDNKALKLSGFFYNGNKIDKNKMELIYNIYDLISNKEIKNCAIKINEKLYFYYISNFNQKIVIIIKNNLPLEEVKEKYLNKVLNLIEYT